MLEDTFIRFDRMYEGDRQTDIHTRGQTSHDDIGRAYASHRAAKVTTSSLRDHSLFAPRRHGRRIPARQMTPLSKDSSSRFLSHKNLGKA